MHDDDCVTFLQWALPRLNLHWPGFRKVRRQVCKRLRRRSRELCISELGTYRDYVEAHPQEWEMIDKLCRVTISRFCRDRRVFDVLGSLVLPEVADQASARGDEVRCWSAGCASGEEVYSLQIIWEEMAKAKRPGTSLSIIGTDNDEAVLRRARHGRFERPTLREAQSSWLDEYFDREGNQYCIKPAIRQGISFEIQDIRKALPSGKFDIILCRNIAFTYFTGELQKAVLERIETRLRDGGFLVIGAHEKLPNATDRFHALTECSEILRYSI